MKTKWLSFCLIAGVAAGCASTAPRNESSQQAQIDLSAYREVVLTVHGLSCPLCSNNLDGQLSRIKGVEDAAIDLKTGAVSVRLASGHAVVTADLERAVSNAGFTLKGIEPKDAPE
jgi:copper chaperone CopZ